MKGSLWSVATLSATLLTSTVAADRPAPPRDYIVETEGGKYVFVMLAPDESHANEALRAKWARSGLYSSADPDTPLWTVDWYARSVVPVSDGERLIRWGPWADSTDDLAVAFYANGEEMNHYHVRELVDDDSTLERSVSHFVWNTDWSLDGDSGVLVVLTTDGQQHRFDIVEGKLLVSE